MGCLCDSQNPHDRPRQNHKNNNNYYQQQPSSNYYQQQQPQYYQQPRPQQQQQQVVLARNQQQQVRRVIPLNEQEQKQLGGLIQFQVLRRVGFEFANDSSLVNRMNQINPSGGTALWDSTALGIITLLDLQKVLRQNGLGNNCSWQFIHIVVTDGEDTASKIPFQDLCGMMLQLGIKMPNTVCRTIFIGVDLGKTQAEKLLALTILGLDTVEICLVEKQNIAKQLDRIKVDFIGVRRQMVQHGGVLAQRTQTHIGMSAKKYAILFNIDMSGSMSGARWRKVKTAVNNFIDGLCNEDLVCGLVFNNKAAIITN